jgi:hypothetical protein
VCSWVPNSLGPEVQSLLGPPVPIRRTARLMNEADLNRSTASLFDLEYAGLF